MQSASTDRSTICFMRHSEGNYRKQRGGDCALTLKSSEAISNGTGEIGVGQRDILADQVHHSQTQAEIPTRRQRPRQSLTTHLILTWIS
jgi:hypothetical protein